MIIRTKARGGRIPRASNYQLTEQANPTTPAIKINPVTCADCREAARASHVRTPCGGQQRLCRLHWRQAHLKEQAEGVRREFFGLFRNWRPLGGSHPGAAIPAPIGERRATA
jgi:hypothetical protein